MCQRDHLDVIEVFTVDKEVREPSEWHPPGGSADSDATDYTPYGWMGRDEAKRVLRFIPVFAAEANSLSLVPQDCCRISASASS